MRARRLVETHVGEELVVDDPLGELVPLVDVSGVDRHSPLDVLREEDAQM